MPTSEDGLAQSSRATSEEPGHWNHSHPSLSPHLWFGSLGEGKGSPSPTQGPQGSWGLTPGGCGTQGGGECATGMAL